MSDAALPRRPAGISRNWALWLGAALTLVAVGLALFGPLLAPSDPLQENYIAKSGERFIRPPFHPGVQGFPLGSDEFGRDVFSRLLWAVGPTMTLVMVVAALRLVGGLLIGMVAGWSNGRVGRTLDGLISAALAVPVLFIALCVIAALANRWGVWAFILGLTLTGWAETARLVQERTRSIKTQPFIEATHALGGGSGQILLSHVIPHILPMLWIQLAFEVSGSLMTAAALGFLGYFFNAVWIPVEDFVGLRASGTPELGQMLGTSLRNQPWTAAFAGTLVFIIILAFNLLGEGLRIQFGPERRRRQAEPPLGRAGTWIEERVYLAATEWRRTATTGGAFALLFLVVLGGGWILWRAQNSKLAMTAVQVPGGHLWAAELRDSQGTYWTAVKGPSDPQVLWVFDQAKTFTSGPVVSRGGYLYLNGSGQRVYSLSPDGASRGSVQLEADPVGWPALTPDGNIVVADEAGDLTAFNPTGELLWKYRGDPPDEGLSSPVVGADGMIYYAVRSFLVAVNAQGEREWQIRLPTYSFTSPLPRLSPQGEYLFFEDTVVDAASGETLFKESTGPMDKYIVGADGKIYFRTSESFMEWQPTETGAVMIPRVKIDTHLPGASQRFPFDTGVSPSGQAWMLYSSGFEYMRMVWLAQNGEQQQIIDFPYRRGILIGMDADGLAYLCGVTAGSLECRAVNLATGSVTWKAALDSHADPTGGALVEGRLYVASRDGKLFALGR